MYRHSRRFGVESRKKQRRKKDMAVCIAAMYGKAKDAARGIVCAMDWQITDSHTSFASDTQIKFMPVSNLVSVMGAGDMMLFQSLMQRIHDVTRADTNDSLSVEDIADLYIATQIAVAKEWKEHNILQPQFGVSWNEFFERQKELSDAYITQLLQATGTTAYPYASDAIILGFDNPDDPNNEQMRIFKITNGYKDDHSNSGFAVIGEGDSIAAVEFQLARYNRFWDASRTAFLAFVAMKRSESIVSVGKSTTLGIHDRKGWSVMPEKIKEGFDVAYGTLVKARFGSETEAYDNAKTIVEKNSKDLRPLSRASSGKKGMRKH